MARLARVCRLSGPDRELLVKAAIALGAIRLGLCVLPFRTVMRAVTRFSQPRTGSDQAHSECCLGVSPCPVDRIAWAVTAVSRYVPGATCLSQAMATQVLLGRRGRPARLRIGVAKGQDGQLEAHAWVESGGVVVIGGPESGLYRYIPLLSLDGARH